MRWPCDVSDLWCTNVLCIESGRGPALQLDRHNRWLAQKGNLPYSRAATVGFRCLKDVPGGAPAPLHYRSATPLRA